MGLATRGGNIGDIAVGRNQESSLSISMPVTVPTVSANSTP
jgi:hypothetical protein